MEITAKELENMIDFEKVKDRVIYKLVRKDEKIVKEVPYVKYLDMLIVFYIKLNEKEYALVSNELAKQFKADTDDLMLAAMENTPRILGASVRGIFDVINYYLMKAGSPFLFEGLDNIDVPLMVLTNNINTYGASTMLYTDLMKGIANRLNTDLYIIPCTIHELILAPVDESQDVNSMIELISNVNDTELAKEDILSYSLYQYKRDTNEITIVEKGN